MSVLAVPMKLLDNLVSLVNCLEEENVYILCKMKMRRDLLYFWRWGIFLKSC